VLLIAVLLTFFLIRYYVCYFLFANFFDLEYADIPVYRWTVSNVIWIGTYFFYAVGFFYFQTSIQKQKALTQTTEEKLTKEKEAIQLEKEKVELEKEKIELEKENIQLENTALRAQINPHFLYNTLNFLYSKSLPVSDELAEGVMKLSDIMRYSLKPQDAEGLVYLADEAEHIQNIVDMNRFRFNDKLNVFFEADDITDNIKIIPLVLITLVENVFKHGITNNPDHPGVIRLTVNAGHKLFFSTHNKKRTGPKEQSTGIGLENTLKRLKNTYQHRCTTTIKTEGDYFSVILQIQLLKTENKYFA
jgi:LytS/YehU family sensor histidine kinase